MFFRSKFSKISKIFVSKFFRISFNRIDFNCIVRKKNRNRWKNRTWFQWTCDRNRNSIRNAFYKWKFELWIFSLTDINRWWISNFENESKWTFSWTDLMTAQIRSVWLSVSKIWRSFAHHFFFIWSDECWSFRLLNARLFRWIERMNWMLFWAELESNKI